MSAASDFNRTITDLDQVRIYNLLKRQPAGHAEALSELIDAAEAVRPQEIGADVATMYSRLRIADPATGGERTLTLCYPADADVAQGLISVLSPMGTALLGLRVGELAEWQGADGQAGQALLRAIEFQPEASGDYTA